MSQSNKFITKVIAVFLFYFILIKAIQLPYINILTIFFGYIPFLGALVLGVILLKPKKEILLLGSFLAFILIGVFAIFRMDRLYDSTGVIAFVLITMYMVRSIYLLIK
jgi:hypothetical protein